MLRLAHQVGGDVDRIGRFIRQDEDFAGPGDHIDVNGAVEELFGGGDVDVPGADDLVHLRDRLGAVGQRRDRLGAAHQEDPVDPADSGGNEDIGVGAAVF